MNRPSRTDEPHEGDGYNQSPAELSNDLTTNEDLNGISSSRALGRGPRLSLQASGQNADAHGRSRPEDPEGIQTMQTKDGAIAGPHVVGQQARKGLLEFAASPQPSAPSNSGDSVSNDRSRARSALHRTKKAVFTFCRFIGPGFMVAVSYSTRSPLNHLPN